MDTLRRTVRRLALLLPIAAALTGCNPTWTKEGKPNDSSMPVPPGASAPTQTAPEPAPAKP
jgi:hypothetical protein